MALANPASQVADLEEELGRVSERLQETETEGMSQQVGWAGGTRRRGGEKVDSLERMRLVNW